MGYVNCLLKAFDVAHICYMFLCLSQIPVFLACITLELLDGFFDLVAVGTSLLGV